MIKGFFFPASLLNVTSKLLATVEESESSWITQSVHPLLEKRLSRRETFLEHKNVRERRMDNNWLVWVGEGGGGAQGCTIPGEREILEIYTSVM